MLHKISMMAEILNLVKIDLWVYPFYLNLTPKRMTKFEHLSVFIDFIQIYLYFIKFYFEYL